jgi:hypothetical protein
LNFGELFEVEHQRERNGVERAIRLATAREIDMHNTIGKGDFAVAGETVEHERLPLIAFDCVWAFEIFIEDCADQIL